MKLPIVLTIACITAYSGQTNPFFYGSERPVEDEYSIVNDIKAIAHITDIDINRWELKGDFEKLVAAVGYGALAVGVYYGMGVINRTYNLNIPRLLTVGGGLAGTIAGYPFLRSRQMRNFQIQVTNYVSVCKKMCIANRRFDSEQSFNENCNFSGYNNIWRAKSALAMMRGIEHLIEQGRYATRLLNGLHAGQNITEEEFERLSKEIGQCITILEHNKEIYAASARIQQGVQTASRAANWMKNVGVAMLGLVNAQQGLVRAQTFSLYANTATDFVKNAFAGWQQIQETRNNN